MLSKKQNFTRGKNKTVKVIVYFQKIILLMNSMFKKWHFDS